MFARPKIWRPRSTSVARRKFDRRRVAIRQPDYLAPTAVCSEDCFAETFSPAPCTERLALNAVVCLKMKSNDGQGLATSII